PDQGPALHLPEERRSSDTGGKGDAVSVGSAEPGHDPSDADPHEPATAVHDERQIGSAFPRPLERLGSSRRPRADEETGQDDHGQVGRHPQIDRHRPFQKPLALRLAAWTLPLIASRTPYRTKRNLKAIVYLIAGDVLANSPT